MTRYAMHNMDTRTLRPCFPDLAPSDYHLFGSLKSELRGNHYENDDELKFCCDLMVQEPAKIQGAVMGWFKDGTKPYGSEEDISKTSVAKQTCSSLV